MKSSLLSVVGSLAVWMAFTPATCRAQSEVAPDHFDATGVELFERPANTVTENSGPKQKQTSKELKHRQNDRSKQTRNELRRRHNPRSAGATSAGSARPKVAQIPCNVLGLLIAIDSSKYDESAQWRTHVQVVDPNWSSGRPTNTLQQMHLLAS